MEIELTQGLTALVDDDHYEELSNYNWSVSGCDKYCYAQANINKKVTSMHRFIMGSPVGLCIDHINHNTLDNTVDNLRICDKSENGRNGRSRKNTSSKYKGLYFSKQKQRWNVTILLNKRKIHIGTFKSETCAAKAYDRAAKKYYGEFACLNFPKEGDFGSLDKVIFDIKTKTNERKKRKSCSSKYTGIYFNKQSKKWRLNPIDKLTGKHKHLGYFPTEDKALEAKNLYLKTAMG